MNETDVLIIGAGHNGLTCAAYLAKAGMRGEAFVTKVSADGDSHPVIIWPPLPQ